MEEKEPLIVGYDMEKFSQPIIHNKSYEYKMRKQNEHRHNMMESKSVYTTYVLPGKHSVFVYDPAENKYYYKIIIVEMKNTAE